MSAISGANTVMPSVSTASQAAAKPIAQAHDRLSFGDLLDVINPLQHIPIVSTLYRKLTGDEMSPTAEIAGGALFGGVVGAVTSIADVLFAQATGKNFGDTVYAWLGFEDKNPAVQLAQAKSQAQIQPTQIQSTRIQPAPVPPSPAQTIIAPPLGRAPVQTIRPAAFVAPVRPSPLVAPKPAVNNPAANNPGASNPGVSNPGGVSKFMENLIRQNIDPATAARAEFAYRSAMGLTIAPTGLPAPGF